MTDQSQARKTRKTLPQAIKVAQPFVIEAKSETPPLPTAIESRGYKEMVSGDARAGGCYVDSRQLYAGDDCAVLTLQHLRWLLVHIQGLSPAESYP
ncbi:hypothetical protein N7466_008858 [Penicillium verhagenii]|uniref:uncharacterized protein n=1 Tax=Penicillium verhagenii TaxID=1562060 RepID=UPI00254507B1|nr:uncharacterized protein N7466_008858 [Penicillium verhagenii]KAJ5924671.1 hypothetical protein N7466_008858 [Penicillium verhagenii]